MKTATLMSSRLPGPLMTPVQTPTLVSSRLPARPAPPTAVLASERAAERSSERASDQASDRAPNRGAERASDHAPEGGPDRPSDPAPDRASDPPERPSIVGDLPGPGTILAGKYELGRVLGRGGMGVVMEARDLRLGRRVAIKMILSGTRRAELVAHFEREAKAAARLQSAYAVRLFDVGVEKPALPFMVMELLEGKSLDAELNARGPLPIAEAVSYMLQACEAMAEAHAANILHRDLKPSNLFICLNGVRRTLKVLDFGISKLLDEEERSHGITRSSFGTPAYMSPERVYDKGPIDARSDVWALGVVLYQLLAGALPFRGETASAVFASIVADHPVPLRDMRPEVPAELEAVLERALCKDPDERYRSALEFAKALAPFADPFMRAAFDALDAHEPLGARLRKGLLLGHTTPGRAGRRWALLSAVSFATALGIVGVWFGLNAETSPPNDAAAQAPAPAKAMPPAHSAGAAPRVEPQPPPFVVPEDPAAVAPPLPSAVAAPSKKPPPRGPKTSAPARNKAGPPGRRPAESGGSPMDLDGRPSRLLPRCLRAPRTPSPWRSCSPRRPPRRSNRRATSRPRAPSSKNAAIRPRAPSSKNAATARWTRGATPTPPPSTAPRSRRTPTRASFTTWAGPTRRWASTPRRSGGSAASTARRPRRSGRACRGSTSS
jgi:eukaryotic-like serine/threonine-protein kinase